MSPASMVSAAASFAAVAALLTAPATHATAVAAPDPPPGCKPPTDGRIALWRGEASPADSTGTNDGVLSGATASYRFGVVGEAFSLPGDGDHVEVPDAPELNLLGDLTIETWVQIDDATFGVPDEHGIGGDRVIAWKAGEHATFGFWIEGDGGASAEAAPLGFISGDRSQPDAVVRSDGLAWAEDTWYHVAITRSGTTIRFYRDGQLVGGALTGQTGIASPAATLTLGAVIEEDVLYSPIKGALDETGLWSRALGDAEIEAIHETGTRECETPTPPPSPPPSSEAPPDTVAPDTAITGPPNGTELTEGSALPVYEFTASEPGARFECRAYRHLSASAFSAAHMYRPCTSPYTVTTDTTTPGNYVVEVRAVDAAGNVDETAAQRWLVRHRDEEVPAADRMPDRCDPVPVRAVRGRGARLIPGCRLGRIRNSKVPCIHMDTGKLTRCTFKRRSGRWVRSTRGRRFAMVGQAISKAGARRGGRYIVAARRGQFQKVPCAPARKPLARAADTQGRVADGTELAKLCVVETLGAEYNQLSYYGWKPLHNWTTSTICTRNHPEIQPHPDYPEFVGFDAGGFACYTGLGAALNDINGTERDQHGDYYTGEEYCHMLVSNGYEVPAAKRPATISDPPEINRRSYIVWRPVNPHVHIANGPGQGPDADSDGGPVY